jgi:hypothetical protein
MTVTYRLQLNIAGIDPGRAKAVKKAAEKAWSFEEEYLAQNIEAGTLDATGEETLAVWDPDTREKSAHDEICAEIWKANGGYCGVFTRWINLDEGPEFYSSPEDYERLKKGSEKGKKSK